MFLQITLFQLPSNVPFFRKVVVNKQSQIQKKYIRVSLNTIFIHLHGYLFFHILLVWSLSYMTSYFAGKFFSPMYIVFSFGNQKCLSLRPFNTGRQIDYGYIICQRFEWIIVWRGGRIIKSLSIWCVISYNAIMVCRSGHMIKSLSIWYAISYNAVKLV